VDEWTTVTPLAIRHPNGPGSPVDRAKFAEEQIRVWCSRAKLPDPVRVVSSMYADLPAIPPAREFKQRSRHSDGSPAPTDWLVHAALRFPVPVKGPLVLGRTANFGAGLMVPASGRVMDQRY
jgi:CRISPR-associated protein Csb2